MAIHSALSFLSSPLELGANNPWVIVAAVLLCSTAYSSWLLHTSQRLYPNIPLVGGEGGALASKTRFARDAKGVLLATWEKVSECALQNLACFSPQQRLPSEMLMAWLEQRLNLSDLYGFGPEDIAAAALRG